MVRCSFTSTDQRIAKGKPNENFARELFELFTLGEGHYSEDDIIEASKALTGWRLNRQNGQVVFVERRHDAGSKTVFGETGNFSYKDILDITSLASALQPT